MKCKGIDRSKDADSERIEKSVSVRDSPDDASYGEYHSPEQKNTVRNLRTKAAQEELAKRQERRRKKLQRYPYPESARGLPAEQISRTSPLYFALRWESYVAIAAFILVMTYFPWTLVGDWGVVRVLVVAMEQLIASIDQLPEQARNLPVDASKAQLSMIHIAGAVTVVYRLLTQCPTMYREVETRRYFIAFIVLGLSGLFFTLFNFLWPGHFPEGKEYEGHESLLQVSIFYTMIWFFQFTLLSWSWSHLQKWISRVK